MIITRKTKKYLVSELTSVKDALQLLNREKIRALICVNEQGFLRGTLSFGDINRWLLSSEKVDLNLPVSKVMHHNPKFIYDNDTINRDSLKKFQVVPIVDQYNRVQKIITFGKPSNFLELGGNQYGKGNPLIIAEIGNNHNGSLSNAFELVDRAIEVGAHCAKFQMRNMEKMYIRGNQGQNLGAEYTLDLLKRFQLPDDELLSAMSYAKDKGLEPLCTPWDEYSADLLDEFGVEAFKVASADFTNHGFLEYLAEKGKLLLCSTGMSTEEEIVQTINLLKLIGADFVLLHCNSTYPAPFKDINLNYMPKLGLMGDCLYGYSGHERDIHVSAAAVALGAVVIERHLTMDRSLEGNDHKVSLLPNEFKNMVQAISQVSVSLGSDKSRYLSQGELINRVTLSKSIYAKKDLHQGQNITEEDLEIQSPGRGLQPNRLKELLSKPIKRKMNKGDVFYVTDLSNEINGDESFSFSSQWGLPVRHHDYQVLLNKFKPPLLEFHLSYNDLNLDHKSYFPAPLDVNIIVHSPELFYGDHTLDLAAEDPKYRSRSVAELSRTIETVKELKQYFCNSNERVGLITNVGGFSNSRPLNESEIARKTDILQSSLALFNDNEVEILPQTMPPFPWHFGGQQFHNLFVDGEWIKTFCSENNFKVCLDVSHSYLACNHLNKSFSQFLDDVLPFTGHLHLADALGVDGEGLQIHDGELDFGLVSEKFHKFCAKATWIPEVWQGHENEGYGFTVALKRLSEFGF
jgi:N-acetylneuraminate synthase